MFLFSCKFVVQALTHYSAQVNVLVDNNVKAVVCDFGEHTNILPHWADWNRLGSRMDHLYPDHKVAFPHTYIRTHMHTQC
jgi:hypothetical protein